MKITSISVQQNNNNRVSISVDGKYRFSLDVFQLADLGVRIGNSYTEEELAQLEEEGRFGKLYGRALEYSLVRPRSIKELRDYLWRKTLATKRQSKKTGEIFELPGVSQRVADRVLERLIEKGYLDDEKFARFWMEYRFQQKGISQRRLKMELQNKGVDQQTIASVGQEGIRSDREELAKVIAKKRSRYPDEVKFKQYLMRQGFQYDDIRDLLNQE